MSTRPRKSRLERRIVREAPPFEALEHVEERDEDRDLEHDRQARRRRVDLVLAVELHQLLVLPLIVVLPASAGSPSSPARAPAGSASSGSAGPSPARARAGSCAARRPAPAARAAAPRLAGGEALEAEAVHGQPGDRERHQDRARAGHAGDPHARLDRGGDQPVARVGHGRHPGVGDDARRASPGDQALEQVGGPGGLVVLVVADDRPAGADLQGGAQPAAAAGCPRPRRRRRRRSPARAGAAASRGSPMGVAARTRTPGGGSGSHHRILSGPPVQSPAAHPPGDRAQDA